MSANRAVSFRERRNVLDSNFNQVAPPVVKRQQPLSQTNNFQQLPSQQSHAYVNLLHQQDQQYNNYQNYHSHSNNNNNNFAISSNNSSLNSSSLHHYDVSQLNSSSSSANVNTSMNSSWNSYSNSPNASIYAQQQQYYIRPRTSSGSKKVPPGKFINVMHKTFLSLIPCFSQKFPSELQAFRILHRSINNRTCITTRSTIIIITITLRNKRKQPERNFTKPKMEITRRHPALILFLSHPILPFQLIGSNRRQSSNSKFFTNNISWSRSSFNSNY